MEDKTDHYTASHMLSMAMGAKDTDELNSVIDLGKEILKPEVWMDDTRRDYVLAHLGRRCHIRYVGYMGGGG